MPLRILLVTLYYPPEITAPAFRWGETARFWAELGAEVTVLTCLPSYPTGQIDARYSGIDECVELVDGVRVIRAKTVPATDSSAAVRFYSQLAFMFNGKYSAGRFAGEFDVVLGTSPPLATAELASGIARSAGRPFVMEVRDLWPDVILDTGIAKARPLISWLYRWEQRLYRRAAHIVTVTPSFVPILEQKGVAPGKVSVIPPGILNEAELPTDDGSLREELGAGNRFIALYLGNHGVSQGLDVIVDAAKSLQDSVFFLFVGDGWERPSLLEQASRLGLTNICFVAAVPKEQTRRFYSAADLCLVPLRGSGLMKHFLPSKLLEILGLGIPVLSNIGGEGARLIREHNAGIVLEDYTAETVATALAAWGSRATEHKLGGKAARDYVSAHFDRRQLAADYLAILERVVRSPHANA